MLGDCFRSGVRAVSLTDHPLKTPKSNQWCLAAPLKPPAISPFWRNHNQSKAIWITATLLHFGVVRFMSSPRALDSNELATYSKIYSKFDHESRLLMCSETTKSHTTRESAANVLRDHEEPHNSGEKLFWGKLFWGHHHFSRRATYQTDRSEAHTSAFR